MYLEKNITLIIIQCSEETSVYLWFPMSLLDDFIYYSNLLLAKY